MFDYKEYVDYRGVLALLIRYYVFVVFFGLALIAYLLPDYKNSYVTIISTIIFLLTLYLVIKDQEIHAIESK